MDFKVSMVSKYLIFSAYSMPLLYSALGWEEATLAMVHPGSYFFVEFFKFIGRVVANSGMFCKMFIWLHVHWFLLL